MELGLAPTAIGIVLRSMLRGSYRVVSTFNRNVKNNQA